MKNWMPEIPPGIKTVQARWEERWRTELIRASVAYFAVFILGSLVAIRIDWLRDLASLNPSANTLLTKRIIGITLASLFLGCILYFRKVIRPWLMLTLILSMHVMAMINFWFASQSFAENLSHSFPPAGAKIALILLAAIEMGGIWINVAMLFSWLAESAFIWYFLFRPVDPVFMELDLWTTVAFMICSIVVLTVRYQVRVAEKCRFEAEARALAAETVAKVFLNVRDRSNTPLQSVEVGLELVRTGKGDKPEIHAHMKNALDQLKGLFKEFANFEESVDWSDRKSLVLPSKRKKSEEVRS